MHNFKCYLTKAAFLAVNSSFYFFLLLFTSSFYFFFLLFLFTSSFFFCTSVLFFLLFFTICFLLFVFYYLLFTIFSPICREPHFFIVAGFTLFFFEHISTGTMERHQAWQLQLHHHIINHSYYTLHFHLVRYVQILEHNNFYDLLNY